MKSLLVLGLFFVTITIIAQEYPRHEADMTRLTDDLAAFHDADLPYEDIYESYLQYFANPINLNKASPDDLRALHILSETQISNLYAHISANGKLLSIYELQSIEGFDPATISHLIPFVMISPPEADLDKSLINRMLQPGQTYFVNRYERTIEKSEGFLTTDTAAMFKGSPDKIYTRFRSARSGDFSLGFTAEKDAGERFAWAPADRYFGFDYFSWHAQLQNKKRIVNLIVGDYRLQFGQGLILGNSFGLGKGGETITTTRKTNSGFVPYTSVNESGNLRGMATTLKVHRHITFSPFYSETMRDATMGTDEMPSFSTVLSAGLHRNEKELGHRKKVRERVAGSVIGFMAKSVEAGLIFQGMQYDIPLIRDPSPYNQFAFQGDRNVNFSAFINATVKNVTFFGEAAKTLSHGRGALAGALVSLTKELDMSVLCRFYDKDFYPLLGNAFSENTISQNETGCYWGFKYRISRKYTIASYADLFRFPWLKFRTYSPSHGNEFLIRFNYTPSRKTNIFVQFRQETKPANIPGNQRTYVLGQAVRKNLSLNFDAEVARGLKMKTRVQYSRRNFEGQTSGGLVILQDVSCSAGRFDFSFRHALFDTDNYENRQYVYEKDLWLAYSLPAYDGQGIRNYLIASCRINQRFGISARASRTIYKNVSETGSGDQTIKGNIRKDIKLQLTIRL